LQVLPRQGTQNVRVRLRENRSSTKASSARPPSVQTSRGTTRCEVALFDITSDAGLLGCVDLFPAPRAKSGWPTPDQAARRPGEKLHRRTRGHIASLTNLVDRGCYLTITIAAETITEALLAHTIADNAAHGRAGRAFRSSPRRLREAPAAMTWRRCRSRCRLATGEWRSRGYADSRAATTLPAGTHSQEAGTHQADHRHQQGREPAR
jgi:hypothetical protein